MSEPSIPVESVLRPGMRLRDLPAGHYVVARTILLDKVGVVKGFAAAPDDDVRERLGVDALGDDPTAGAAQ